MATHQHQNNVTSQMQDGRRRITERMNELDRRPGETNGQLRARAKASLRNDLETELRQAVEVARSTLTPGDFDLARSVISRFAGPLDGKWHTSCNGLSASLGHMARVSIDAQVAGGRIRTAAIAPIAVDAPTSFPWVQTQMEKVGITGYDVRRQWVRTGRDTYARLDDITLALLVPPAIWPLLIAVVNEGPACLRRRLEAVMYQRGVGGDQVTAATLKSTHRVPIHRLAAVLVEMAPEYEHHALAGWTYVPDLPDVALYGVPRERDVSPPPISLMRSVLRPWWLRLEDITDGGRRLPPGRFKELRLFLFVTIMIITGSRISALRYMTVDAYDERHVFPDADLPPGPGVCLDIAKQEGNDPGRWKAIPAALVPYMRLYLEVARVRSQAPDAYLWVGHAYPDRRLAADERPVPWKPRILITGSRNTYLKALERKRLAAERRLAKAGMAPDDIEREVSSMTGVSGRALFIRRNGDGPWDGYHQHGFRGAAFQLLSDAAAIYLASPDGQRTIGGAAGTTDLANSVLDHVIGSADAHQYGVCNSRAARELNSARLAPIAWELLVGELGAPKGIDQRRLQELRAEEGELMSRRDARLRIIEELECTAIEDRRKARSAMRSRTPKQLLRLDRDALLEIIIELQDQQRTLDDRFDAIDEELLRSRATATRDLATLDEDLRALHDEIREVESVERPLLYLEEKDPAEGEHAPEQPSGAPLGNRQRGARQLPVRSELRPRELAQILGHTDDQMVRRWLRVRDFPKNDRGVPWTKEDLIAGRVFTGTGQSRLIQADAIDRGKLTPSEELRLDDALAQELPPVRR